VEERRDAALLAAQLTHTRDPPDGHEDQGSGAGEVKVSVLMAESAPSRSVTESLNASQPTSP